MGARAARSAGVAEASGNYIGFVDADDWIARDMYEKMLLAMQNADADICICGVRTTTGIDETGPPKVTFQTDRIFEDHLLSRFCQFEFGSGLIWNKLYRSEIVRPYASLRLERCVDTNADYIVNVGCFYSARRVVQIKDHCYFYFQHPQSMSKIESTAVNFLRLLRAYVSCCEIYPASIHSEIGELYARQLRFGCYRVPSLSDLQPHRADLRESIERLAAVNPEGIYSLVHAFDGKTSVGRASIRGRAHHVLLRARAVVGAWLKRRNEATH